MKLLVPSPFSDLCNIRIFEVSNHISQFTVVLLCVTCNSLSLIQWHSKVYTSTVLPRDTRVTGGPTSSHGSVVSRFHMPTHTRGSVLKCWPFMLACTLRREMSMKCVTLTHSACWHVCDASSCYTKLYTSMRT